MFILLVPKMNESWGPSLRAIRKVLPLSRESNARKNERSIPTVPDIMLTVLRKNTGIVQFVIMADIKD
jgi:hypothetical protein